MPTKDPLNRYISILGFLEVGLGTSLGLDPGLDPGPDPGPDRPDPGPDRPVPRSDPSNLNNIQLFTVKRQYEPLYPKYSSNKP